jgi:hypothetical protein
MTEQEWLDCADPDALLAFVFRAASERKLRLFAVACCRRLGPLLSKVGRKAVAAAEAFAESRIGLDKLERANLHIRGDWVHHRYGASHAVTAATERDLRQLLTVPRSVARALAEAAMDETGIICKWSELQTLAQLVRDVFGNPFRTVSFDPDWARWHEGLIPKLALGCYEDRDFDCLPVLADALEEAGCADRTILDHCRLPGPHVRGCVVVDLILGKGEVPGHGGEQRSGGRGGV